MSTFLNYFYLHCRLIKCMHFPWSQSGRKLIQELYSRQDVANRATLPAAELSVDNEFWWTISCRRNDLVFWIQTQNCIHAPVATKYMCGTVCSCMLLYLDATWLEVKKEAPDPEKSTRNMMRYLVEIAVPPFVSIKTCNNARAKYFFTFQVSWAGLAGLCVPPCYGHFGIMIYLHRRTVQFL